MIGLSQSTGYAIRALSCLDDEGATPRLIRDVAACSGLNKPYLAKIVNQLARSGLVAAKRGYHGGIALTRPAKDIPLLDIVLAVEGEHWIGQCLLGIADCEASKRCPTQRLWRGIRAQIENMLKTVTLADVIQSGKAPQDAPRRKCCGAVASVHQPTVGAAEFAA